MLHFLTGEELKNKPDLRDSMFMDRKKQFVDRLGWSLTCTNEQFEVDQYDRDDSCYVICSDSHNRHLGSMRLLPTNLPNMIQEHFSYVIPGISFSSDRIWECTRLCTTSGASPRVAYSILAGAAKFMRSFEINAFLGLFDKRMHRAYRRLGATPMVIGSSTSDEGIVSIGLWQFERTTYENLVKMSAYNNGEINNMFKDRSLSGATSIIDKRLPSRAPERELDELVA